ncbi:opacity family porin [Neisseria sp. Dent CA1/247]|uniref:opacity family porin n=1 Tax=Neisseria sp. Dent CA1/247 TaxID=2912675 RepID=UPI002104BA1A|nr:opacity family porin [Neisseria sp. Dent CA1/247]
MFLTVFFLTSSVSAFSESGIFVQPEAALSQINIKNNKNLAYSKNSFSPRLTVGYDFGNHFRIGVDYTHYKPLHFSGSGTFNYKLKLTKKIKTNIKLKYRDEGRVRFNSAGLSAAYDFPLSDKVKPYVGARLAHNRIDVRIKKTLPQVGKTVHFHKKKSGLGAGVSAGVGFKLNEKAVMDVGYRYNYWGKFQHVKIHRNEIAAGLRVTF